MAEKDIYDNDTTEIKKIYASGDKETLQKLLDECIGCLNNDLRNDFPSMTIKDFWLSVSVGTDKIDRCTIKFDKSEIDNLLYKMSVINDHLIKFDNDYFNYKYDTLWYTHVVRNDYNRIRVINKSHGFLNNFDIDKLYIELLFRKYKYISFDTKIKNTILDNITTDDCYFFKMNDKLITFRKNTDPLYIISILKKILRIFDDVEFDGDFYNKNRSLIRQESHLLELIYSTNKHD